MPIFVYNVGYRTADDSPQHCLSKIQEHYEYICRMEYKHWEKTTRTVVNWRARTSKNKTITEQTELV